VETPWQQLRRLLDLWGLELDAGAFSRRDYLRTGEAFVTRAGAPLILQTLTADGAPLILQTLTAPLEMARCGDALRHWDGHGAVRLMEQAPDAVLTERPMPGGDLRKLAYPQDSVATGVLCDVMARLARPAADGAFPSVAELGAGFIRHRTAAIAGGTDAGLIDEAQTMFAELCRTQASPVVLHGDLTHRYVIRDDARGWLAIAPLGMLGEPAFETSALLCSGGVDKEQATDAWAMPSRAEQICERLGYPFERVIRWCFCRAVLDTMSATAYLASLGHRPDRQMSRYMHEIPSVARAMLSGL
jgi:streptomycin 6-kinase